MATPDFEQVLQTGYAAGGDAQTIVDTALTAAEPEALDSDVLYSRIVPAGATGEVLDLEKYLPAPRRARGAVAVQTVDDLVLYAKRHDNADATTLWVNADTAVVIAVLNDHAAGGAAAHDDDPAREPGWGDHRATLTLKPTPEWLHWTGKDNKLLDQETFAEHIEDGLLEIVDPDGATMLEVAQSIQGRRSAEFSNARRLHDGNVGVSYVEETTATAGARGELEIPERLKLAIAPFLGEEPVEVNARLRWRLRGGDLQLGYKLERPERVVRDVIDAIATRLNQQFQGDRVFVGAPRA